MINLTEACRMNHRSGGAGESGADFWAEVKAKGGDSDISDFYKPAPSKKNFPPPCTPSLPRKATPRELVLLI